MNKKLKYIPMGVCSRMIDIEIENDKIKFVNFHGGCNGNLKGISTLVVGYEVNLIIEKLQGIKCNGRDTSCPDQLAKALLETELRN